MGGSVTLYYDGHCPFCTNYAQLVRLRETHVVEIIDLRSDTQLVERFNGLGLDLNEGFVVEVQNHEASPSLHHGHDGIHVLGLLSDTSWFGHLNRFIFSRRSLTRLLYPFLKAARNAALFATGKSPIEQPDLAKKP